MRSGTWKRPAIWIETRPFRLSFGRDGFSIVFRKKGLPVAGLLIKPKADRMFSERYGGWLGMCIGPIYVRTFTRRECRF